MKHLVASSLQKEQWLLQVHFAGFHVDLGRINHKPKLKRIPKAAVSPGVFGDALQITGQAVRQATSQNPLHALNPKLQTQNAEPQTTPKRRKLEPEIPTLEFLSPRLQTENTSKSQSRSFVANVSAQRFSAARGLEVLSLGPWVAP